MKNLEQIRAANALAFWKPVYEKLQEASEAEKQGEKGTAKKLRDKVDEEYGGAAGGDVVSKLPSLIRSCGLLATLAFAKSKKKGYEKLMLDVIKHLASDSIRVMPVRGSREKGDGEMDPAIRKLTECSSVILQRATSEALHYLGYLKRFAPY